MSAARLAGKKWADVDEDDEEGLTGSPKAGMAQFETKPDEQGVKMVIDYIERDGRTYKVTKKIKQTTITTWTNRAMTERQGMKKFGKTATVDPAVEKRLCVRSEEEVPIELSKKLAAQASVKDEAEDKFYEESLTTAENLNQQKKAWSAINRERQVERDEVGVERPAEPDKPAELREAAEAAASGQATRYVPPSLRGKDGDGKGKGKGGDAQQQEASLRVTNLAEDVKEGDLYDLFGGVGRVQRVFLAKDMSTGQSRGFGFVTYYSREDAVKAINRLNGHGYDNLILQVQFAKPRQ